LIVQELQKTIEEQQNSFHYVNITGQELIHRAGSETQSQRLKDELQDLNTRWSDIPIILDERQKKLQKGSCFSFHRWLILYE
jgi:DNA gyrase/topoisomerase IV subunit B